ncbi:MAG: ABC transporter ATP-binding protein [Methylotenera sp.]|nr:ABC transporter ATP-binding protein [Oligoflexia bacterium]
MLEISNVVQTFRTGFWMKNVTVLHDVSFTIPDRSVFGFLGANGAGKTTLIALMVGLRQPTSGTVKLKGIDCYDPKAKAKVGYLPERPYFHDHLTGENLLKYFGALSGMSSRQIEARTVQVLKQVGMSHARKLELKKYSKGMLQRIGIAQAILHEPEFLVLDEPMSGLDPVGRKEIRELITQLAHDGHTVFFSSHVIPDVEAICDRVALIQKGKLLACGSIHDLLAQGAQGSGDVEVGFQGVSLEVAQKLTAFKSVRVIPEGIRAVHAGQQGLEATLSHLIQNQAKILWVQPIRPSLEDVFK